VCHILAAGCLDLARAEAAGRPGHLHSQSGYLSRHKKQLTIYARNQWLLKHFFVANQSHIRGAALVLAAAMY
jgi:hypothetical protein